MLFRRRAALGLTLPTLCALVIATLLITATPTVASDWRPERADRPAGVRELAVSAPSPGYWTASRKRAARPMSAAAENTGSSGASAPQVAAAPAAKKWAGGGVPAANVGRVFFTTPEGDHSCSASVIAAANRDTVVTAAHCVRPPDQTELARNWIFAPGYDGASSEDSSSGDATSPYGEWTAKALLTPTGWYANGRNNLNEDVGFVVLNPLGGRHVADVVGSNRIAFNTARSAPVHVFGYPAQPPFDGESLYYCAAPARPDTKHPRSTGLTVNCDLNQGASGGPWFVGFSPSTGGTVVSVSSTLERTLTTQTLNGPSFDSSIKIVYEAASARR